MHSAVPLLRITCRYSNQVRVGNSTRQGVLISDHDVRLLRTLAEHDFTVSLEGPGMPKYHAHAKTLLKRVQPVPGEPVWYVSTTLTGPLRQALPERLFP